MPHDIIGFMPEPFSKSFDDRVERLESSVFLLEDGSGCFTGLGIRYSEERE
jgi:hypothetical protein